MKMVEEAAPLTTEELTELDTFLLAGGEAVDRLMLDELHGFLTAVAVTHQGFDLDGLIGELLGPEPFADEFEEQHIRSLVQRLYLDIETGLSRRQRFEPLVIEEIGEEGEIEESYEGWCFGFMLSVAHHEQLWQDLPKHEDELMAPIATLSLLHSEEDADMELEEYLGWVEMIPGSVAGLYAYFGVRA